MTGYATSEDFRERITSLLSGLVDPVVLELGAWTGSDSDTVWLRQACNGMPTYIAVEPDPRHLPLLSKLCGIRVEPVAIASYTGMGVLHLSDHATDRTMSSSIRRPKIHTQINPSITFNRSVNVRYETLDDLTSRLRIGHVDLIWADVQGAEGDMVMGGQRILRKTDWLFVESYPYEMYEGQTLRPEFLGMLPQFEVVLEGTDDVLLHRRG